MESEAFTLSTSISKLNFNSFLNKLSIIKNNPIYQFKFYTINSKHNLYIFRSVHSLLFLIL